MPSLLQVCVALLCLFVSFGLIVCALERQWGTLAFATLVFALMGWLMIYGSSYSL